MTDTERLDWLCDQICTAEPYSKIVHELHLSEEDLVSRDGGEHDAYRLFRLAIDKAQKREMD